eukprot:CAMPEP_0174957920 /NCGR_PEP_ID=MMETSP0004_2-20121128/2336_1 /TAXON_ID=420556 /ORGANISM="Ochromonas sp., Strain CCMP1393" /LENGTH=1496 /DNA_ID=CAMNT_0016206075 /DNA_START=185 /DNA_END=4675 /DNA_ORIENTATION=+
MKEPLLTSFMSPKPQVEREINLFVKEKERSEAAANPDKEANETYAENIIISSRYTVLNFLPKSLLEQFRRLANVYFLVIGIIAIVGTETNYYESAIEPEGILAPMIAVVLLSVIKDGVEDVKRHNQDAKINSRVAHKMNEATGEIEDVTWRSLEVGDTIVILSDEEIPADVAVLACGGVQGPTSYVETAAIDGETNLKMKNPCLVTGINEDLGANKSGQSSKPALKPTDLQLNESRTHVINLQKYMGSSIMAEVPNGSIHRFNGVLQVALGDGSAQPGSPPVVGSQQRTLTEKNLLLRGSMLRATEWAICTVVYTGADTKLSLNSKQTPSKLSSIDRIVNRTLVVAIGAMLLVCIVSMVFSIVWEDQDSDATYLCLDQDDLDYRYTGGGGCEDGSTSSILTIFTFATLYNNFVCISMYISLEAAYLCQAYFLSQDLNLYDEAKDTPAECHTSGQCADLGQVQYVLSDKTGTLTKNQMVVQQISIAETVFGDPIDLDGDPTMNSSNTHTNSHDNISSSSTGDGGASGIDISLFLHNTMMRRQGGGDGGGSVSASQSMSYNSSSPLHDGGEAAMHPPLVLSRPPSTTGSSHSANSGGVSSATTTGEAAAAAAAAVAGAPSSLSLIQRAPRSGRYTLTEQTPEAVAQEAWLRRQFVRVLVYCNTAMLMPDASGNVHIEDLATLSQALNAESPDEVALITAAAQHCGVLLTSRNNSYIECKGIQRYEYNASTTSTNSSSNSNNGSGSGGTADGSSGSFAGPTERVELLAVNEFDSDRKMMSVLVRYTDTAGPCGGGATASGSSKAAEEDNNSRKSRVFLLCKGADSSVLKRCRPEGTPYTQLCSQHITDFANVGLRTLVSAIKIVPEDEAQLWLKEYNAAANSISNRAEMLTAAAKHIEHGMTMLGAVGIEDELQDGVPESISMLHSAGVNVWMITGDKAETALAIGKKCHLIDLRRQELERMVNLSDEALRLRVSSLHTYVFKRKHREEVAAKAAAKAASGGSFSTASVTSLFGFLNSSGSSHTGSGAASPSGSVVSGTGFKGSVTSPIEHDFIPRDSENDGTPKEELALMVDGVSLEGIWSNEQVKMRFVEAVQLIPTVIACRVSPLQKAALVRMIKAAPEQPVTLAIGDGANDVGMIHEARVGVGISGNEGRHAANSADFAISQFSYLVTLMFSHGRFNYIRCSKLVLYSFFKNLLLVSLLFYYCTYSGFSGTLPLDSLVFSGYNFYLGLPILAIAVFDFDVSREDAYKYPRLAYNTGRFGEMLNIKTMARWSFFAFIQGLILFVIAMRFVGGPTFITSSSGAFQFHIFGTGLNSVDEGWGLGMYPEGFLLYCAAVTAMCYKVVAMAASPNWIFWSLLGISYVGFIFFVYLYGLFPSIDWYNTLPFAFSQPNFWLAMLLIPLALSISDYAAELFWRAVDPSSQDVLIDKLEEDERLRQRELERSSVTNGVVMSTIRSTNSSIGSKHSSFTGGVANTAAAGVDDNEVTAGAYGENEKL